MKSSRPPLVLMEQMVMVLVFALCAALCVQVFVKSDNMSRESEQRDRAMLQAQSAAEVVRHCRGDMFLASELLGAQHPSKTYLMIDYDADWALAGDTMRYTLGAAVVDSGVPGLGKAQIWIRDELRDKELLRMDIAWQDEISSEVSHGRSE